MRRKRAAGEDWADPRKEADRKFIWYHLQDGKEKLEAARQKRKKAAAAKPCKVRRPFFVLMKGLREGEI